MPERTRAGQARTKTTETPDGRSRPERAGPRPAGRRLLSPLRKPEPTRRSRQRAGRYTAPTPRQLRRSPGWYPWVLLGLAIAGVGVIIANYSSALPHSPSNWYTLGSLIALLTAALLATRYR